MLCVYIKREVQLCFRQWRAGEASRPAQLQMNKQRKKGGADEIEK
jgi:hypothetical protein